LRLRSLRLDRTLAHARRYRHILAVLMRYGFEDVADALGRRLSLRLGARAVPMRVRRTAEGRSRPVRVRLALQELGPTFIKLGQLLSTRPDLAPAEYVEELEKLQDQVPPEKFARIRAEVERSLGGSLEELFERFDEQPIAAGSIGQVHEAVTRDGRRAVVKVRRPGIVQTIRTECEMLEDLAGLAKLALPKDTTLEPLRMVREFTTAVGREVDLARERSNQQRFRRNFAGDPTVRIPEVYEDYCAEGVLTMERLEGLRPAGAEAARRAGLDPELLARRGVQFGLRQVFEFGLFHTDPHPGNLFFLPGSVIGLVDYGQVSSLLGADRRLLGEIMLAVVERDAARVVAALARADVLDEGTDVGVFARELEEMLLAYTELPVKEVPFRQAMTQSFEIIRRHRIHPPAQFTLMLKSLMTIESFAVSLDRDFQIVEHLRPYARKFSLEQLDPRRLVRILRGAARQMGELAVTLPADLHTLAARLRRGQFQLRIHHEHLENLANTLDKSSNRISFALIIAGLLIGSSFLVGQQGYVLGVLRLQTLGVLGYFAAAILGFWLLGSIIRRRHL